jgi:hypothetical protein
MLELKTTDGTNSTILPTKLLILRVVQTQSYIFVVPIISRLPRQTYQTELCRVLGNFVALGDKTSTLLSYNF